MGRIANSLRGNPGLQVAIAFLAILALSLAFGGLVSLYPSQQDRCDAPCAGLGGELTSTYSLIQSGGNQYKRGPLVCKCVQHRTQ